MSAVAHAATLRGRVVDSTAAILPGVTVEVTGNGTASTTISRQDGTYALTLKDGAYDVAFRLVGFAATVKREVVVIGETTLDATLHLSISADVVVTAKRTFRNLNDLDEPVGDLLGIADAATAGVVTAAEIERRPFQRAGEILESVPGVIVSQHSGEGKANQYYMRGFNLDHGTDIAITVANVPVNMPSHAHGQGYADANFLIPELIGGVQYRKGPYYADQGDFASAGAVNVNYLNLLVRPIALGQIGMYGYQRALVAASPRVGDGFLLFAIEATRNQGPWVQSDDYRRFNTVLRYSAGGQHSGYSITAMGYDARWRSSDQIPQRALNDGSISRFGLIDPSDGGTSARYSLSSDWQRSGTTQSTQASAYVLRNRLDLFSNFTYFLDDPVNGDQFEQKEDRLVYGFEASHRWLAGASENVIAIEGRRDDIDDIGLHRTVNRRRLSTVRQDDVLQTSMAAYAQNSMQWSPRIRTLSGIRFDRYAFEVDGTRTASLVSPKLSAIFGPWRKTELYLNAGSGFHSNDARGADDVTPLARTKGAEIGIRSTILPRLHFTAALWGLDIASELVFVGDAGTTEPGRPSRRSGVELAAAYSVGGGILFDAQYAYSRGRFTNVDPAGNRIPGAVEGVASAGVTLLERNRVSAELRYRYFGPRPLIEDDSIRSESSSLVSARIGYALSPSVRLEVDVFNLLDAEVSDVDYYYTSRLRGETEPVDDLHFHPVEKRSLRVGLSTRF